MKSLCAGNRAAFDRIRLKPRTLVDVSKLVTKVKLRRDNFRGFRGARCSGPGGADEYGQTAQLPQATRNYSGLDLEKQISTPVEAELVS
ncbi:MAG: hypothetical protein DMG77_11135 [Acidobacteria bacterium]|nr:MAG: hypothetical protein DMG77_11135 [Acidobacteriota bacterium]